MSDQKLRDYLNRVTIDLQQTRERLREAEPVPGAAEFAEELQLATALAAGALLTGQPVEFDAVREAQERLEQWLAGSPGEVQRDVLRTGTRLLLQALKDLERALRGGGTATATAQREPEPSGR
ncbi:polyketide synthase docking domain-containing protein [Kitasatospora sp. NPDC001574]